MHITALILAAIGATAVSGQYARVLNGCTHPAYVQSVPYDGSAPGPVVTIQPREFFEEPYRASGSTIKMGTLPQLAQPLDFGYSRSNNPSLVYYELNNQYGNPFSGNRDRLYTATGGGTCPQFDCQPNDTTGCYSNNANKKILSCPRPTNTTVELCAALR